MKALMLKMKGLRRGAWVCVLAEAVKLQEAVVEVAVRKFSDDHPFTWTAKNGLSMMWHDEGVRLEEARALQESVLEGREEWLGLDHPNTIRSRSNLGAILTALNQPKEACQLLEGALKASKQVQGADHPSTLEAMQNLAAALFGLEEYLEVVTLQEDLVNIWRRKEGLQEGLDSSQQQSAPGTMRSMSNLDVMLKNMFGDGMQKLVQQGQKEAGWKLLQEALNVRKRVQGMRHKDTITTLASLASMQIKHGDPRAAVDMIREAREVARIELGTESEVYQDITLSCEGIEQRAALLVKLWLLWVDTWIKQHGRRERCEVNEILQRHDVFLGVSEVVFGPQHDITLNAMISRGFLLQLLRRAPA
jgi:hypothetical protein